MTENLIINIFLILNFLVFALICFMHIEKKSLFNKTLFYTHLLVIIIVNMLICSNKVYNFSNNLTIISSLLMIILLSLYFVLSLISFTFVRLRLIFLPFFLILLTFFLISSSIYRSETQEIELFKNKFLITHILSSLFSYSMLTMCSITSLSVFAQEKILKNQKFNKYFSSLFPSVYEGEKLTIKFLKLTLLTLIVSLVSGFYSNKIQNTNLDYFYNEKSILSIFTLLTIIAVLFLRGFWGLTTKTTLKTTLMCYFFINFSYFGIKLIN